MIERRRTNEKLKKSCDYIRYEVLMLHHSLFRMTEGNLISADKNCYVEAYAIHLRCLVEFLKYRPSGEYIRAKDFLDEEQLGEWNECIEEYSETFNLIKNKADIQLAHLSYDREKYKGNKKGWEYKFCNIIDECLLKWSSLVPKSRMSEGLRKVITHFQKITPKLLKKTLSGAYKKQLEQTSP